MYWIVRCAFCDEKITIGKAKTIQNYINKKGVVEDDDW